MKALDLKQEMEMDRILAKDGTLSEEQLLQLSNAAKEDCRDCDGKGIFYGNVCVCRCVGELK